MLIMMSCAKTMTDVSKTSTPFVTTPWFQAEASEIMLQLAQCSVEELEHLLGINAKLAVENFRRYQTFLAPETIGLPAILAYTGIVFKRLNPNDFSADDFAFAQDHLRIMSFGYGLLRPLDVIKPYRLEGKAKLQALGYDNMFAFWRDKLTECLIRDIKACGGVLCNLASDEMKGLFDWHKIMQEVEVVTPEFYVKKKGKLATVVVYTKMARGEMVRYILKNRLSDSNDLKAFSWEGFDFMPDSSDDGHMIFVNGAKEG